MTDHQPAGVRQFTFIGKGDRADLAPLITNTIQPWGGTIGLWRRFHDDPGVDHTDAQPDHPANYRAHRDLTDAVNTALALSKPLLLTGNPGTGKSHLAERVAWEFNLGPVLRFEAQSLSEAIDLFYRFDLIGHLAAVEMFKAAKERNQDALVTRLKNVTDPLAPERFVKLGPLGEAIVRSDPKKHAALFDAVFGPKESAGLTLARPCVVLIDEIDKASRDFPNDLLNGIERLEFRIRELGLETMRIHERLRPIVIVTSNSERDLPAPFLRRCTYFHIPDPTKEELIDIVAQRFFASKTKDGRSGELPPFYLQLLDVFWNFRDLHADKLQYRPGTSELIDWTAALQRRKIDGSADLNTQLEAVRQTASSVSKHQEDHTILRDYLSGFLPARA